MKFTVNWKAGILSGIVVAIAGIGFFAFVGSKADYTCKYTTPSTPGCRTYNAVGVVINGYADIFRSIFAKRCVGGMGPDDCLGPDGMIMLGTLLAVGFIAGSLIFRKKPKLTAGPKP